MDTMKIARTGTTIIFDFRQLRLEAGDRLPTRKEQHQTILALARIK